MRRIAVSALRERIGDVFVHVGLRGERIVLTRHGRALGAIVPMEDLQRLRALEEAQDPDPLTPYRTSWRKLTESIHRRH